MVNMKTYDALFGTALIVSLVVGALMGISVMAGYESVSWQAYLIGILVVCIVILLLVTIVRVYQPIPNTEQERVGE